MKKAIFLLISIIAFGNSIAQDKSIQQIREPDFYFEPAFLDSNNIQYPLFNEKVRTLTYQQVFKTSYYLIFDSVHSAFSIKGNTKIRMLVKCNQLVFNGNPKDYFRLFALSENPRKNERRCLLASNKSFVNSISNYNPGLPIYFSKSHENVYTLTFENLDKGEYALLVNRSAYSFRVF